MLCFDKMLVNDMGIFILQIDLLSTNSIGCRPRSLNLCRLPRRAAQFQNKLHLLLAPQAKPDPVPCRRLYRVHQDKAQRTELWLR